MDIETLYSIFGEILYSKNTGILMIIV